jgi:hypothetical protein
MEMVSIARQTYPLNLLPNMTELPVSELEVYRYLELATPQYKCKNSLENIGFQGYFFIGTPNLRTILSAFFRHLIQ